MVMHTTLSLTLAALMLSASGIGQTRPTFEAASIKPDKGCPGPYGRNLPGRLVMNCYSIQELVAFSWGLRKDQVVGQFFTDRYDIEATMDGPTPINQMYGPMLQALLEDRFALKSHRETRDLPIFNLIVAKGGVKMPPAKGDCVVSPADGGPPLQGRPAGPVYFCDHPNSGPRTVVGKGITMKALSDTLSRTGLEKTVVDKTGLTGAFDVTLKWTDDLSQPGADPSLFTALQEQLGLRLEAARGLVDVLVIDRVEKPTQ